MSPASGTAPQSLQVSAAIAGLTQRTYTGHITVTATGATGSPVSIKQHPGGWMPKCSTIASPAFSTTAGKELHLAFVSTDYLSGANTTVTGVSGGGLTWVLVVRTNAQSGSPETWRAFAASPSSNVTVTATLSQSVLSSTTILSFTGADTTGTNGSGAIGATKSASSTKVAPAATLVTMRNNSWVFGVGNDSDNAIARTPGTGQTVVHQDLTSTGDTYWVQMQNAATPVSGTSVTINDTAPTGDRYNLTICEILPALYPHSRPCGRYRAIMRGTFAQNRQSFLFAHSVQCSASFRFVSRSRSGAPGAI